MTPLTTSIQIAAISTYHMAFLSPSTFLNSKAPAVCLCVLPSSCLPLQPYIHAISLIKRHKE